MVSASFGSHNVMFEHLRVQAVATWCPHTADHPMIIPWGNTTVASLPSCGICEAPEDTLPIGNLGCWRGNTILDGSLLKTWNKCRYKMDSSSSKHYSFVKGVSTNRRINLSTVCFLVLMTPSQRLRATLCKFMSLGVYHSVRCTGAYSFEEWVPRSSDEARSINTNALQVSPRQQPRSRRGLIHYYLGRLVDGFRGRRGPCIRMVPIYRPRC